MILSNEVTPKVTQVSNCCFGMNKLSKETPITITIGINILMMNDSGLRQTFI